MRQGWCIGLRLPVQLRANNHFFDYESVIICDQGNDSVDYAILKDVKKGDLVITQDYGEAGMLLTKGAIVVHPSGFI